MNKSTTLSSRGNNINPLKPIRQSWESVTFKFNLKSTSCPMQRTVVSGSFGPAGSFKVISLNVASLPRWRLHWTLLKRGRFITRSVDPIPAPTSLLHFFFFWWGGGVSYHWFSDISCSAASRLSVDLRPCRSAASRTCRTEGWGWKNVCQVNTGKRIHLSS